MFGRTTMPQRKTLILVFSLIGIIGTLATNEYMKALERGKVFSTKYQLMYSSDFLKWYSEANGSCPQGQTWNDAIEKLRPTYTEKYITEIMKTWDSQGVENAKSVLRSPATDAWGRSIKYETWNLNGKTFFRLGSSGKDGIWQHPRLSDYPVNLKTSWNDWSVDFDIVFGEDGGIQAQFFE